MLSDLKKRFFGHVQQERRYRMSSIRECAYIQAELNLGVAEGIVDEATLHDTLVAEGWSWEYFERLVQLAEKRIRWSQLAEKQPTLKLKLDQLEAEFRLADEAETVRRREALKQLQEMQEAILSASAAHQQAVAASAELFATAASQQNNSAELLLENARILADIDRIENQALNPRYRGVGVNGDPLDAGLWPRIDEAPAALAADTKRMLDNKKLGISTVRREQLLAQLAAAEKAVDDVKKKLPMLLKRKDEINKLLVQDPDFALKPENFAMPPLPTAAAQPKVINKWGPGPAQGFSERIATRV